MTGNTGAVTYTTTVTSANVGGEQLAGRSPLPGTTCAWHLHGVGHRRRHCGRRRHLDLHPDRRSPSGHHRLTNPYGVAVTPDGSYVYVATNGTAAR